jgi:enterochelin esterase-like enzyme
MNRNNTLFCLTILIFCVISNGFSQRYSLYSDDKIDYQTSYLNEPISINLHLPEAYFDAADGTKFPVIIIFDSQHNRSYPQIMSAIDLLTSETQMPESIVVGVPFNMNNRLYFTSNQKKANDSLSGIERMNKFIFSELLPKLQNSYKANSYTTIIGHSRTAFLVNYLSANNPKHVNNTVSLSGFFDDALLSLQQYHQFLSEPKNFETPFKYYYYAGTSLEERTYLNEFGELNQLLKNTVLPEKVSASYKEVANANHMTNYWVPVPEILIDVFKSYNNILDTWLQVKLEGEAIEEPVKTFAADLSAVGNELGLKVNPNLTHIYSLANHYRYQNSDYKTAIGFVDYGLSYFSKSKDLHIEMIELYKALDDKDNANLYKKALKELVINDKKLSSEEREEYFNYLNQD